MQGRVKRRQPTVAAAVIPDQLTEALAAPGIRAILLHRALSATEGGAGHPEALLAKA
jgi:hypothetical protein